MALFYLGIIQTVSVPRSCARDAGRSLDVGLQDLASNHLKLRWSRAMVVGVKEKAGQRPCQVRIREASASELLLRCRNEWMMSKLGGLLISRISSRGTCLLLGRHPA